MAYSIQDYRSVNSFVAFDVETTGLDANADRIIEIAGIKYLNNQVTEEFVSLVKPDRPIPPRITDITGIDDEMVADAPSIEEVLIRFIGFTEGLPLVAHNADFDMGFLQAACHRLEFEAENGVIDTLGASRKAFDLPKYNLGAVRTHLGIDAGEAHRAAADARVCGEIFLRLKLAVPEKRYITITQLNKYIKNIIEKDEHLFNILVKGEISNFKKHFSGHCYMTLKDEASTIRAVMFKGAADKLKFEPQNGMKVVLEGRVSVYERDGQYQLYIERMQPDGVGDLHLAFEQLKEKLKTEGLFDGTKKKMIPKFPQRVGVVTSPSGAAVRDIINVMTRRFPQCDIILHPAQVQGEGGAVQVAAAIGYFNEKKLVDLIIVGRGGGSIEELWVFNEEAVARAIAASEIPIISAVGHETDFTIADFVADLRAPTPSAAAELAVPSCDELRIRIDGARARMTNAVKKAIERRREILKRFAVKSPLDMINQRAMKLDNLHKNMVDYTGNNLTRLRARLAVAAGRLDALSPLAVMERGYSVTQKDGKTVMSVNDVATGDLIINKVKDGKIYSRVEEN